MQLTVLPCRCKEDATWGTFNSEDLELRELKVWTLSLCWGDLNRLGSQKRALTGLFGISRPRTQSLGERFHTPQSVLRYWLLTGATGGIALQHFVFFSVPSDKSNLREFRSTVLKAGKSKQRELKAAPHHLKNEGADTDTRMRGLAFLLCSV